MGPRDPILTKSESQWQSSALSMSGSLRVIRTCYESLGANRRIFSVYPIGFYVDYSKGPITSGTS